MIGFDRDMHPTLKRVDNVGPDAPLARSATAPDGEVIFYVGRNKAGGSFLSVANGLPQGLRYRAVLVMPRNGDLDFVPTSVCPVAPTPSAWRHGRRIWSV